MIGSLATGEVLLLLGALVGALALVAFPASRICSRIGMPAWLGLLAIVPVVNVGLLLYVAFAKWPAEDARRGLR